MSSLYIVLVGALFFPSFTSAQIPTVCSDAESLENLRCCPTTAGGVCGVDSGRGQCVQVDVDGYSAESSDVRANWPHYYTQVCNAWTFFPVMQCMYARAHKEYNCVYCAMCVRVQWNLRINDTLGSELQFSFQRLSSSWWEVQSKHLD